MSKKQTLSNKIRTKLLKIIDFEIQLNDTGKYNNPRNSFLPNNEKPIYQINIEENYSATNNYVYFIYNNNSDKKKEKIFRDYYKCMGYLNSPILEKTKLTHNITSSYCIQISNNKKSNTTEENNSFSIHHFSMNKFPEKNNNNKYKTIFKRHFTNDIININNKFYLLKSTNQSSKTFIIQKTTDSEKYLIDLCNKLKNTRGSKKKKKSRVLSLGIHSPKKAFSPKKLKFKTKKDSQKTTLTSKLREKIAGSTLTSPKKLRKDSCSFLTNHEKIFFH